MTKVTLPAPREPAVDLRSGTFTRNWILYLQQSFERMGGSDAESITAITTLVRQILQDIADNGIAQAFSDHAPHESEDVIEFSPTPVIHQDRNDDNDYSAEIAELRKKISELENFAALIQDPSAIIAEAVKKTKIAAAARVTAGNVAPTQLIPWDTVTVQSGIKYDSSTRRFTVPVTGNYLVTASLFKLASSAQTRVLVGVNTDSPTIASNSGHTYADGANYTPLSISNILPLQAGDYVTFLVSDGSLYSQPTDQFNFCALQFLG